MARIDTGTIYQTFRHKGIEYKIRNTEEFENESFGFPINQDIPTDHYEFKHFQIIGAIASGKTTLAERYYGHRILQQWGDGVDFFKCEDLFATIDAVKNSRKMIHYVILDDAVSKLDSRRSMGKRNVAMTELYYEIRHELAHHAKKNDGNAGGLVILAILTQDQGAIDKRIRENAMFNVFKTYDKSCDEMIPDPEIIEFLKEVKDKSVRLCNYNYRKFAVGVDIQGYYTLFWADRVSLPMIHFKSINGEDKYRSQRDELIDHLVTNFSLFDMSKDEIKAELYFILDEMEGSGMRIRLNPSNFQEIMIRAKGIQSQNREGPEDQEMKKKILSRTNERSDRDILKPVIRKLRNEQGLSFRKISAIIGHSISTVHAWYHSDDQN